MFESYLIKQGLNQFEVINNAVLSYINGLNNNLIGLNKLSIEIKILNHSCLLQKLLI